MQAITAAANVLGGKYLTDCTLYVTGTLRDVRRCHSMAQTGRLVFGADDEKDRNISAHAVYSLHPKTEVVKGHFSGRSRRPDETFFNRKDNLLIFNLLV